METNLKLKLLKIMGIHQSATALKILTAEVDHIDCLVSTCTWWDILGMKQMDLSDFDKVKGVKATQLGKSISEGLLGCSWYAVVNTSQKWTKDGQKAKGS